MTDDGKLTEDQRRWIEDNMGIAGEVAGKHRGSIGFEEAMSAAMWGLIKAVQTYDPSQNTCRSTHAWYTCYWHIKLRSRQIRGMSRRGKSDVRRTVNFTDFRDGEDSLDPPSPSSYSNPDVDRLNEAINRLPIKYAVFIRMVLEGMSPAEIRRLNGYTKSQVQMVRRRAMTLLANFLRPTDRRCTSI